MMRALMLAGLLAGCAAQTPDQRACEAQAEQTPEVKALLVAAAGRPEFGRNHEEEIKAAKQDATLACLRGRGVVRGGGVERQRP